jgi:hypothetical protein
LCGLFHLPRLVDLRRRYLFRRHLPGDV